MRAKLAPYAVDPFGPSANPSAYVACEASERARAILERSLQGGRVAALMGPPGHGKTLLLRLIGGRQEERARVAYVPFCTLEFDELCAVVLNAIGVMRTESPRDALMAAARDLAPRGGVVILVDDAHGMSDACAAALAALYHELAGALRIALAAVQGPGAQRVFRAFGSAIDVVLLAEGMTGRECRRYVETRLAYGGARPEIVAAFDEATIEALHRASQGVPRRLNQAAETVVRRATRSDLPRLRELTAGAEWEAETAAPAAPDRAVSSPPEALQPPAPANAIDPTPVAPPPEPESTRPSPARPAAPSLSIVRSAAPPPAIEVPPSPIADPNIDDGRGVLLPEFFERRPGEPAGEYRIVRGTALRPLPPHESATRGERPSVGVRETLAAAGAEPAVLPRQATQTRSPTETRRPQATRGIRVPNQVIGVVGFLLGIAAAMTWMTGRGPSDPPTPVPEVNRSAAPEAKPSAPAPVVQQPPRVRGSPTPPSASPPAPVARAPEPTPPAPAQVPVSINATPWAIVRIDGREIGETPLAGIPIEVGRHVFEARMPDGTTREQTIDISAENSKVVF